MNLNYTLSTLNYNGFIIEISEDKYYSNSNNKLESIEFNICEVDKNINFEDFKNYFGKKINSSSKAYFEEKKIEDLIKCLYGYYFGKTEAKFKTGESLTINTTSEHYSGEMIYQINFMLENYPVMWNEIDSYKDKNIDYQLFISEISKANNDLWKLELFMTKKDCDRYFLGGRFKLFIKAGDIINLKYYEHPLYNIVAEVMSVDYNSISLKLPRVSKPSRIHNIKNGL
ncbi:MAG: hypothetical protein ACTTJ6_09625 [Treponema sp.]